MKRSQEQQFGRNTTANIKDKKSSKAVLNAPIGHEDRPNIILYRTTSKIISKATGEETEKGHLKFSKSS